MRAEQVLLDLNWFFVIRVNMFNPTPPPPRQITSLQPAQGQGIN